MTNKKSSRTRLSLQHKLEALHMLSKGTPRAVVVARFKVSTRFITKLRKEGEELLRKADEEGRSLRSKSIRNAQYPQIDDKVYRFCEIARSIKLPATQDLIRERALLVRESILKCDQLTDADRARFEKFSASVGWCQKFVKRHGIISTLLARQAESATVDEAAEGMANLHEKLRAFDVENIYNVDETELFFKLLPRRSYIMSYENKKTLRGTRSMNAKDRITAYVCTNAGGSQKLPMAIIGKTEKLRCFRMGAPVVPYFSNKTAWLNSTTFRMWFNHVFLLHVRATTSKPVALIADNASSHNELRDLRGQVHVLPLLPNVTAVHQPMDTGIIFVFKRLYRKQMLRELVRDIESRAERRLTNRGRSGGMNGLAEGYVPHMLDVTKLVKMAWEGVSQMTISRCWVKSCSLPLAQRASVTSVYGRMRNSTRDDDTKVVLEMLEKLRINVNEDDSLIHEMDKDVSENDVEKWLQIEEDNEVTVTLSSDIANEIDENEFSKLSTAARDATKQDDTDEEDEAQEVTAAIPTLADIYAMFRPAQSAAFHCNLPGVSNLLQRALNLCQEAIRDQNRKAQRQLLVTEMLRK